MTVEIPLTQGQVAIVSDEDADLAQFKWHALFDPGYANGGAYKAARNTPPVNGRRTTELMHRIILSRVLGRPLLRSELVDHENRNTLNNTRENLRLATPAQNQMNKLKQVNNTSGYKGVSWFPDRNKWSAHIKTRGRLKHLGYFSTGEEAYEAYKKAAAEEFGKFARFE